MLKSIIAVVAGLFCASVVVTLFDSLPGLLYTIPMIHGVPDIASVPFGAMLLVALGWGIAAFAGGAVAQRMGAELGMRCVWIVATLFTIVVVINLTQFFHPMWMWAVGIILPIPSALVGAQIMEHFSQRKENDPR